MKASKWYEGNTGTHQGLIVDENTGESIAVSYKKENAKFISASPQMLDVLKYAAQWYSDNINIMPVAFQSVVNEIESAIQEAEGN